MTENDTKSRSRVRKSSTPEGAFLVTHKDQTRHGVYEVIVKGDKARGATKTVVFTSPRKFAFQNN